MIKRIDIIAGARPNFVKIGPIIHAITNYNKGIDDSLRIKYRLVHTGQHYDKKMSGDFFQQLNIPEPSLNLGVGSGSQATQTANIMIGYELALQDSKPDLCIVVGDVTSTMACAITAKKMGVKVAHVEGGIRSNDEEMPEEINRMVTDSITDIFFTTTLLANENLKKLGHDESKIHFVGNTMIDSLIANQERLIVPSIFTTQNLKSKQYLVMTLHRPSNVDSAENLTKLLSIIDSTCGDMPVLFPMHPRTKKMYDSLDKSFNSLVVTGPMTYLEFIYLIKNAKGVITDSGGITEETTVLDVPCITLRDSTERPETVTHGTNEIVGTDPSKIGPYLRKILDGNWKLGKIPDLWDGKTADRIVEIISNLF